MFRWCISCIPRTFRICPDTAGRMPWRWLRRIAHKGSTAGAKVQAMTALDFLLQPELVKQAWDYFRDVQTKEVHYESFSRGGRQADGGNE